MASSHHTRGTSERSPALNIHMMLIIYRCLCCAGVLTIRHSFPIPRKIGLKPRSPPHTAPARPSPPQSRCTMSDKTGECGPAPPRSRAGVMTGNYHQNFTFRHNALTAAQPPCFKSSSICNNMPDEARGALRDYCYILLPSRIVKIF